MLGALLVVPARPTAQAKADVALRAAMETETVKGDLKGAIEQYKKIVASAGTNRTLAAQALVRMAECYQKLGDAQARAIYERVVREFGDQRDAVEQARARLAGTAASRGLALRKVWSDPNVDSFFGGISPDGRYLTYAGRFNTAVILRDLVTGEERPLTSGDSSGTFASAISKDGNEAAYDWYVGKSSELWVASLRSGNPPPSRRILANEELSGITPHDWSPDGKRIAVSVRRQDGAAQIGLVGVADGSFHVLKSVDWRGPTRMFFSPDGLDIAFDLPANDSTEDRDVFVLGADGSREIAAATNPGDDAVIGWAPDGRHLLFASDRNGTMGLWALAFVDHKPQGAPALVKADIGNVFPLGITRSGALYTTIAMWDQEIEIAAVDLGTGKQTAAPVKPIQRFAGANTQPAWSSDGKWLAYRSARGRSLATGVAGGAGATSVLGIRSTDTGDIRELRPALSYFQGLTWAPDGGSLVAAGGDLKGRDGVFRIDARTGHVTPLFLRIPGEDRLGGYEGLFVSPDGKRLYYRTQNGTVHERDLSSESERVVVSGKPSAIGFTHPNGRLEAISVSPDGRWIAATRTEAFQGFEITSASVVVMPVDGGESRTLLRVDQPMQIMNSMPWTPDGRAILVLKMGSFSKGGLVDGGTNELWYVPVDGGTPRKLDIDVSRVLPGGLGRIRLHPDGRQLAFVSGHYPVQEVWVLENFLPVSSAKR